MRQQSGRQVQIVDVLGEDTVVKPDIDMQHAVIKMELDQELAPELGPVEQAAQPPPVLAPTPRVAYTLTARPTWSQAAIAGSLLLVGAILFGMGIDLCRDPGSALHGLALMVSGGALLLLGGGYSVVLLCAWCGMCGCTAQDVPLV